LSFSFGSSCLVALLLLLLLLASLSHSLHWLT
jgi:hypothetical protein